MGQQAGGMRWLQLVTAVGALTAPLAHAEEPLLQTRLTLLASDLLRPMQAPPGPDIPFVPVLNLGVGLRSTHEPRGWLLGTDLSLSAGPLREVPSARGHLRDNSSALFVRYRPTSWAAGEETSLTVYPLSTSRLRLGWSYPVTWGGGVYGRRTADTGLRAEVVRERWHAFAAVKTPGMIAGQWPLAPMAGAGVSVLPALRLEVQAGLVPHATTHGTGYFSPHDTEPDVSARGHLRALSARLLHRVGEPVGASIDFGLRGRAPEMIEEHLRAEQYPGGLSSSISLEATHGVLFMPAREESWLSINGPRLRPALRASANALALDARIRWNRLRVHTLVLARSAAFVLADDASLWGALSTAPDRIPELGATVGADYYVPRVGLTPGLVLRVTRPAALRQAPEASPSWRLLSPLDLRTGMPHGELPAPVMSAQASLKWDVGTWIATAGEVSYTTHLGPSEGPSDWSGPPGASPAETVTHRKAGLGFNLLVQARY